MNTAGGFIFDATQEVEAGPSRAALEPTHNEDEDHGSVTARKLSSKQEVRLMNYLDDAFLEVNRGYTKRHNSRTSSVPTLDSFLRAYDAILTVIASIPPIGPSAALLVSYLLRLTSEVLDGVMGYEVASLSPDLDDEEVVRASLDHQLRHVVQCLSLLDRIWSCVLRGQLVDLQAVKKNIERDIQQSDESFPAETSTGQSSFHVEEQHLQTDSTGRYPLTKPNSHIREGRSIIGSKGFATVAQTDRIRLRNVITLGKENLFSWMRVQLNVPLPPRVEVEGDVDGDEEAAELIGRQGDKRSLKEDTVLPVNDEEQGEDDLEEVNTDQRGIERQEIKEEDHVNSHFDDLFARKIDPDASDSDDEKEEESPPSPKRRRRIESESRQSSPPQSNDVESVATFSGTAVVMKWDIKFARLFSHTLRCLSDIQEYSNQRESKRNINEKGEAM